VRPACIKLLYLKKAAEQKCAEDIKEISDIPETA
jgi:hypothetical protein